MHAVSVRSVLGPDPHARKSAFFQEPQLERVPAPFRPDREENAAVGRAAGGRRPSRVRHES